MDFAKGTAVAGLYDELMAEILSRVPVKDLRRSKCVSKPWRDLIADPLNRKKLPQTLEGFFHGSADGCRSYGHFASLSDSGESVPPVDPSFSFLTGKLPGVERMVLLDSCNGLLLFGCSRGGKFGYIVCNPATEELVTLPASSSSCPLPPPMEESYHVRDYAGEDKRYAHTFLMFDPAISSHFHLVQIWDNFSKMQVETVHSYSSETRAWIDRSSKWNRVEWELQGQAIIKFANGRALINGLLHFIVFDVQKSEDLIVVVDGEGKTCKIIHWQREKFYGFDADFIGQSQDHLHCIAGNLESPQGNMDLMHMHYTQLSVWVLEDYDTQEWILKHNVSSSQFVGLLSRPIKDFQIVVIHPDHNSIILAQRWDQKLLSYNIDSKEVCALHTLGKGYLLLTPYVPCFKESSVLGFLPPRIEVVACGGLL